jgi:hypothetical protein
LASDNKVHFVFAVWGLRILGADLEVVEARAQVCDSEELVIPPSFPQAISGQ